MIGDGNLTVMIKNINARYQQEQLLQDILSFNFIEPCDINFFCLPVEPSTGTNRGVAFVHSNESASKVLLAHLDGQRLPRYAFDEKDEPLSCLYCPTPAELLVTAKPVVQKRGQQRSIQLCSYCNAQQPHLKAFFCPDCGQRFETQKTREPSLSSDLSSSISSPTLSFMQDQMQFQRSDSNEESFTPFHLDTFEYKEKPHPGKCSEDFMELVSIQRLMTALGELTAE